MHAHGWGGAQKAVHTGKLVLLREFHVYAGFQLLRKTHSERKVSEIGPCHFHLIITFAETAAINAFILARSLTSCCMCRPFNLFPNAHK